MVRLETGDTGIAVTAESDGTLYSSIFGIENYVVSTGNMFKAEIQSNNKIKVSDGSAIMNGRHIRIPSGDSELVTIDNGSQGMNRIDLIVLRYKKNSAGVESGELVVIKGMETSDVAKTPDFTHGDILTGAAQADFPLYEVELNGINIINLRSLFETVGNITGLEKQMSTINKYLSELREKTAGYEYSKDEQIIGKWIDGRNLYRKVLVIGNVKPNANITEIAHNIKNLDRAIHLYGSARNIDSTSRFTIGLPYPGKDQNGTNMSLQADSNSVYVYTNPTTTPYSVIVVMEYIKIT